MVVLYLLSIFRESNTQIEQEVNGKPSEKSLRPSSGRKSPKQCRRDLKTPLFVIVLFTVVFGCVTDCNCNL